MLRRTGKGKRLRVKLPMPTTTANGFEMVGAPIPNGSKGTQPVIGSGFNDFDDRTLENGKGADSRPYCNDGLVASVDPSMPICSMRPPLPARRNAPHHDVFLEKVKINDADPLGLEPPNAMAWGSRDNLRAVPCPN